MKKVLSALGALALTAGSVSSIQACTNQNSDAQSISEAIMNPNGFVLSINTNNQLFSTENASFMLNNQQINFTYDSISNKIYFYQRILNGDQLKMKYYSQELTIDTSLITINRLNELKANNIDLNIYSGKDTAENIKQIIKQNFYKAINIDYTKTTRELQQIYSDYSANVIANYTINGKELSDNKIVYPGDVISASIDTTESTFFKNNSPTFNFTVHEKNGMQNLNSVKLYDSKPDFSIIVYEDNTFVQNIESVKKGFMNFFNFSQYHFINSYYIDWTNDTNILIYTDTYDKITSQKQFYDIGSMEPLYFQLVSKDGAKTVNGNLFPLLIKATWK